LFQNVGERGDEAVGGGGELFVQSCQVEHVGGEG